MKEKTFEELLTDEVDFAPDMFGRETVLNLMQQVREATISECRDIALQDDILIVSDITTRLDKLPTDRIKLTEK